MAKVAPRRARSRVAASDPALRIVALGSTAEDGHLLVAPGYTLAAVRVAYES